jgi:hypothetical protein
MIEHDGEVGQPARDFQHRFELRRSDRDGIEGQPRGTEQPERFDHLRLQQPFRIGLVADEVADADQLAAPHQFLERLRGGGRIGQRNPADHATDEIRRALDVEEFARLVELQHLHQHGAVDAAGGKFGTQIVGREIAVETLTCLRRPVIGMPADPPKVMMRVDDAHAATNSSCIAVSQTVSAASVLPTPI